MARKARFKKQIKEKPIMAFHKILEKEIKKFLASKKAGKNH